MVETSHHIALESARPWSKLVHDAVLRAAYSTSIEDERVRQHIRDSSWEQIVEEQRRLIITGSKVPVPVI